jgi:hypothetical protein
MYFKVGIRITQEQQQQSTKWNAKAANILATEIIIWEAEERQALVDIEAVQVIAVKVNCGPPCVLTFVSWPERLSVFLPVWWDLGPHSEE